LLRLALVRSAHFLQQTGAQLASLTTSRNTCAARFKQQSPQQLSSRNEGDSIGKTPFIRLAGLAATGRAAEVPHESTKANQ
jgi:secreted PhoX family phosphatase